MHNFAEWLFWAVESTRVFKSPPRIKQNFATSSWTLQRFAFPLHLNWKTNDIKFRKLHLFQISLAMLYDFWIIFTQFKGCPFYNDVNRKSLSNFHAVERLGLKPVWDIEDLVTIGKNTGLCPYFGARNLMDHADIIFCPYNYIIDPFISEAVNVHETSSKERSTNFESKMHNFFSYKLI